MLLGCGLQIDKGQLEIAPITFFINGEENIYINIDAIKFSSSLFTSSTHFRGDQEQKQCYKSCIFFFKVYKSDKNYYTKLNMKSHSGLNDLQ